MKERKHLRLRSLAAFLVPLAFAVFLMQPTQLGQLLSLAEVPAVFLYEGTQAMPRRLLPDAELSALLTDRWCVKSDDPGQPGDGDFQLAYENAALLLMENRQYLILKDGRTFQIPGKTLLPLVSQLLEP